MSSRETEIQLRLPARLERAVEALVLTSFSESYDVGPGNAARVHLDSTHDAIIYLILRGIKDTIVNIDHRLDEKNEKLLSLQAIITFFDVHPLKTVVQAKDFPDGSATAALIGQMCKFEAIGASGDVNAAAADNEYATTKDAISRLNNVRETLLLAEMPPIAPSLR